MNEIKLLPCPFCGQEPRILMDDSYNSSGIFCTCEAEPGFQGKVNEPPYEKWNTRFKDNR